MKRTIYCFLNTSADVAVFYFSADSSPLLHSLPSIVDMYCISKIAV
jgi:hypothetical protein